MDDEIQNLRAELNELRMQVMANEAQAQMMGVGGGAMPVLNAGGGGGYDGCFDIETIDEVGTMDLRYCYYAVGGNVYAAGSGGMMNWIAGPGIVALCVTMASSTPTAVLATYANFAALKTAAENTATFIRPLYQFNNQHEVEIDFRNMPTMEAIEISQTSSQGQA